MSKPLKRLALLVIAGVLLGGIVSALTLKPRRDSFGISIAGRTNDAAGDRVLIVVSNRSNREYTVWLFPNGLVGTNWQMVQKVRVNVVLPGRYSSDPSVGGADPTSRSVEVPFPPEADRLAVKYFAWRKPRPIEVALTWCLVKLGMRELYEADFEGFLYVDR